MRANASRLFWVSFLILLLELAFIRYFASTVVFLTFFTNIVLIACFLGMSVGCLAANAKRNWLEAVAPLLLVAVTLAAGVLWAYERMPALTIDVGGQQSPQLIYFGTEYRPRDPSHFVVPIEAVAGGFYVLIALIFIGLGQEMGRAFDALQDKVKAYSLNVAGSLAGIVVFGLLAKAETGPVVWLALSLVLLGGLLKKGRGRLMAFSAGILAVVASTSLSLYPDLQIAWSPYYKITYQPKTGTLNTNNISHQQMMRIRESGPSYSLPHLLNRDSGGRAFEDVLVIGAGSGNDVAAALLFGARNVDAVEIDPVLNRIGRRDHPDRPYDDPRVRIHLDDGRSFLQKTDRKYDLILYALVDSLVLHSGYSSLRLESFLFTKEAFEDIRARLKPGGVFAMYNYYRQGWVVGRLDRMADEVFGARPLVMSLPYQETIRPSDNQANHITLLLTASPDNPVLKAIRKNFEEKGAFWVNERKILPASVDVSGIDLLPTDSWPFLYLREKGIPFHNLRGMILIAILSLTVFFAFAPVKTFRPNGRMFFLGAGFMLLETKGVVHLALLFGSTWIVNSVVFFAILVMILAANLYVQKVRPERLALYYAILVAALLVNVFVTMRWFLDLPDFLKIPLSGLVVFLPVFFAGVIFASNFRTSARPDIDFGSNVLGVILGGLSEYLSLLLGFDHLLIVAILFYGLSAVPSLTWRTLQDS